MAQREGVVLVTGSSGFIGSATVERLASRYTVVGLDSHMPPHPPPVAECVCVDLTSDSSVAAAFKRVRIAYGTHIGSVIHLAAYFDLTGEPNPLYDKVTVQGTGRLLAALQDFGVEQFVFSSTMLVHAAARPGQKIHEDVPLDPKLPYRRSKIRTEQLIHEKRGSIPTVILRPAGVYDDLCRSAFLAQQIGNIYERKLISRMYPGDLRTGQSFVHRDDVIEAIVRAVEKRAELPPELALLIGEPEAMSYDERQRLIERLIHDQEWETREVPKALARTGAWLEDDVLDEAPFIRSWMIDTADDHYDLDVTRARTMLGWEPQRSLRQTLPKMIEALKADPPGWYRANKLDPAKVAAQAPPPPNAPKATDHTSISMPEMAHDHMKMMVEEHHGTSWPHLANAALGIWLLTSPFVLGLFDPDVARQVARDVTAERGLAPPELRNLLTAWSDIGSGALIAIFGLLSLSYRMRWAQWANTVVGLWLLFAPLVFWTPSAAAYTNDTIVGALVIAFAVLVPMMPGMDHMAMMSEVAVPPGWTYCPSTYLQRLPIIALGFVGFVIARYLTAFQLGHIPTAWDPFFGTGTMTIITSDVSKAWPIPDAGLGAVSYMLEVLMGAMGDKKRWRTMPWMVTFFGILVVPLGTVSIYFIIIQPIVIGTWCTLCLVAALAMVIMIPFSLDELVAMGQFLVLAHREGQSFWRVFFMGGALRAGAEDRGPGFGAPIPVAFAQSARGLTAPWTLVVSAILGGWLMLTRLIFGTVPPMAHSDHLVGALVITVAVFAMAEVARSLRFINALFGAWLVVAPWLFSGESAIAAIHSVLIGLLLVVLSLPRGKVSREHYGSWGRYVI